jgi:hypothetical protein
LINLTNLEGLMNKLISMLLAAVVAGVSFNAIAQDKKSDVPAACKDKKGAELEKCVADAKATKK